jgi:hypothetical protein
MKVRLTFAYQEKHKIYNTGETPDLPDDIAKKLVSEGRAEYPPKVKPATSDTEQPK